MQHNINSNVMNPIASTLRVSANVRNTDTTETSVYSKGFQGMKYLSGFLNVLWPGYTSHDHKSNSLFTWDVNVSDGRNNSINKMMYGEILLSEEELICKIDKKGNLEMVSPLFSKEFSCFSEDLSSLTFQKLFNQNDSDLDDYMKKGGKRRIETFFMDENYQEKWYSWTILSCRNSNSIYLIGVDISSERMKKKELKLHSDKLEEMAHYKTDGLNYAKILQQTILHDPATLNRIFPESFIFHSSKDIVSGDFYWFEQSGGVAYVACADCTGHGVPGAMLSMLGIGKLYELVKGGEHNPSIILDHLNNYFYTALSKKYGTKTVNDGMDIAFFTIDHTSKTLNFAGAKNPLIVVRNGEVIILEADRQSIGVSTENYRYETKSIQLMSGDMVYTFTDGFADQFGGDVNDSRKSGKKFSRKRFKNMLQSISGFNADRQKELIGHNLQEWSGEFEQTDDICIVGVRIS